MNNPHSQPEWQAPDDQLDRFARMGTPPFPPSTQEGWVETEGGRIWYAQFGRSGPVLVLLHGGLGHSGNWALVLPHLLAAGWQVVVVDSRGHGRSTRDGQPYSYELMGRDVERVLNALGILEAQFVGWSDGACTALALAKRQPQRVTGIVFFACNVDASGSKPFELTTAIENCIARHRLDYRALSATPEDFDSMMAAVSLMQSTQPNYNRADLAAINTPVLVLQSPQDEFIRPEHARYLAEALPHGQLMALPSGTHFAPLQRPEAFARTVGEALAVLGA